jgi:hypothetical protein
MKFLRNLSCKHLLLGAAVMFFFEPPAQAALCSVPDTGPPIVTVNPAPSTVPPPATCLVDGMPGVATDLPGYILKASRVANIVKSGGVQVGNLYDRVYCKGVGFTCDSTHTYIIAIRARLLATPECSATGDCFRIDNYFRNIRGTAAVPVPALSGYWMGSGSTTGTDPVNSLALDYLWYTGKTLKGETQVIPPGTVADRDNTKLMYWSRLQSDGVSNPWSPWYFVQQFCPFGGATDHFQLGNLSLRYWPFPSVTWASSYVCKTS